ncbi:MAG: hypothetical protein ABIA92_05135, partial [Patescibacteria group bacterium]
MKRHTLAILSLCTLILQGSPLYAATGDTVDNPDSGTGAVVEESGLGKIIIEQIGPVDNIYAEWTLIKPNSITVVGRHQTQTISVTPVGNHSILVNPLDGATASLEIYVNDELSNTSDHPQANFILRSDETIKI